MGFGPEVARDGPLEGNRPTATEAANRCEAAEEKKLASGRTSEDSPPDIMSPRSCKLESLDDTFTSADEASPRQCFWGPRFVSSAGAEWTRRGSGAILAAREPGRTLRSGRSHELARLLSGRFQLQGETSLSRLDDEVQRGRVLAAPGRGTCGRAAVRVPRAGHVRPELSRPTTGQAFAPSSRPRPSARRSASWQPTRCWRAVQQMVLISYGQHPGIAPLLMPVMRSRAMWVSGKRPVAMTLLLEPTVKETLAKLGKSTRFNLGYYRRRLQAAEPSEFLDNAGRFLAGG